MCASISIELKPAAGRGTGGHVGAAKEAVTLSEHVIEIVSDSGEGAQRCGQSFGAIAARMANGTCSVLGTADRGRSSGETRFLTSGSVQQSWERRVVGIRLTEPLESLLVGTDGGNFCSNPACHGRKWPELSLDAKRN